MSYSDLLKDPRWQRKRLEVLEAAGFRCWACDDDKTTLHVHHTYYKKGRKPWEYEADALRCLCEFCHAQISASVAEVQRIVGSQAPCLGRAIVGYARALAAQCGGGEESIPVEHVNVSFGVASFCGASPKEVMAALDVDGRLHVPNFHEAHWGVDRAAAKATYAAPDMCPDCNVRNSGMVAYPALREEPVSGGMYTAHYRCGFGHEWFTRWAPEYRLTADDLIKDLVALTEYVEVPA